MSNPDVEELLKYNRDGIKAECSRKGHPNRVVHDRRRGMGYCDDCRTPLGYIDLVWLGDYDDECKAAFPPELFSGATKDEP